MMKDIILKLSCVVVLIIFPGCQSHKGFQGDSCPCKNHKLCEPISHIYETEVFIFSLDKENYKTYDWNSITTIAATYTDPELVCFAHSFNARVVYLSNFPVDNLTHPETFQPWIDIQLKHIRDNFLDGINVDFESAIDKDNPEARNGLTKLMSMLTTQLKSRFEHYQVTFDFAWSPNCIDDRCFDFAGIADIVDYVFIMSYDERSQIFGPCTAWANSAYNTTKAGVKEFLNLGIPSKKVILGVPWYGYNYPCLDYDTTHNICKLKKVPFRGVECSDAAGREINYSYIVSELLPHSFTGPLWDSVALSPYFSYKNATTGQIYQIWYDDPKSLLAKYHMANELSLAGVGMWNADAVDYGTSEAAKKQRESFWGLLPRKQAYL